MPRYNERDAREAVAASKSYAESLRNLGMCPTGGAGRILKKWIEIWEISTEHFDPRASRGRRVGNAPTPLAEILVEGSEFRRTHLKERLFREGIKARRCEMCGLGETWRGRRLSLILDHVNGVRNDNRLENLRVVCPNCAATLDTHCGRNKPLPPSRECARCGAAFKPRYERHRHCSRQCGSRYDRFQLRTSRPDTRKVERPSYEQLRADLAHMSYVAVGRKYGVSDNAVRKWLRLYERDREAGDGRKAA